LPSGSREKDELLLPAFPQLNAREEATIFPVKKRLFPAASSTLAFDHPRNVHGFLGSLRNISQTKTNM